MKEDELKSLLDDMGTFLTDLNRMIPGRVDEELISFLASTAAHPWQVQLLHGSLEKLKKEQPRR